MSQTRKQPVKEKTSVLIVDDHPIARQGLAQLINQEPDLCVCCGVENATQALQAIKSHNPSLAIVDISLKESSGIELVKDIKAQFEHVLTLVFSMHNESLFAERALKAGASGYVMKQEPTEIIITAIRRILDGDIYLSDQMTTQLLGNVRSAHDESVRSPIRALSDREFEVFNLIGQGHRTDEIADLLHLSPKTIETYRANIRRKLNLKGAFELTQRACNWVSNGQ